MINIGILDFLMSKSHHISVLNCSSSFEYTDDLFEIVITGKYCDSDIDLGLMYLRETSNGDYLIVDGKRRILSLMLLFKAIEEYHSNLAPEVSLLANQINVRYLKYASGPKLQLLGLEKTVYDKLINDEAMSYNEKQTEIYKTFELLKDRVRELDFEVEEFYALLDRLTVNLIFLEDFRDRDIFYSINKDLRPLNQMMLIKSYLAESYHGDFVDNLYFLFGYQEDVFVSFFRCYLSPKFNRMITGVNSVYYYFVKYFTMIKKYQTFEELSTSIIKTAKIYKKMYNAEFLDHEIRNMFIRIISNNGRDTFSYLLELCEDFENKLLSKETLQERKIKSTYNDFDFAKMANELNKVIYEENNKDD